MANRRNLKKAVRNISEDLMVECLAVKQDKPGIAQADVENIAKSILMMENEFIKRLSHVDKKQTAKFFQLFKDDITTSTNEIVDAIFHLA